MEIERINDSTIKFYITYRDIEDRGFDRDEIWYNRERGEELFFEMMNEATDHQDSFEIEGPLWIQIQALEKGLEVVVTRGQISDGNVKLEIPVTQDKGEDMPVDDNIVDMLDEQFRSSQKNRQYSQNQDEELELVIEFKDLEDLISLSQSFDASYVKNEVYHFQGSYYLYLLFDNHYTEDEQDDMLSRVLEYGEESDVSIYRIREYGKTIVEENGLQVIKDNFS
ncbi:adaptor protein MecA [Bacillus sp. FJAT-44742]|uniref:adaptor protein MecA n=1 Tax=Bacillus sp. FJAT-44742 TaxID=2014005 RepID=UPI000C24876B|nr:adaptor protein MecA [Bacillus sp. FJAT-44742]